MRLFADHCIPTDLVETLRTFGLSVERASDVGLAQAADDALFTYASKTGRVLLTSDRDFGNMIRFDVARTSGIVIVELEHVTRARLCRRVHEFFRDTRPESLRGRLTLLQPHRIRTWPRRRN